MSTAAANLGTEQFRITAEDTPKTYHIYMQYPVEVTECWANISRGKKDQCGGQNQRRRNSGGDAV